MERNKIKEGKEYLSKSLVLSKNNSSHNDVYLEGLFYSYAHFPDENTNSVLKDIRSLLVEGVRSEDWNFEGHFQIAKKNTHPNLAMLKQIKEVINNNADISTLDWGQT